MICGEDVLQNSLILTATVLIVIITYYQWSYRYWKRRNLPYLKPRMPFGNFANPFLDKNGLGIDLKQIYEKMRAKGWKHGGIFFGTSPTYVVIDPNYVNNILTNNFQYFSDRGQFFNKEKDPLTAHVSALGGAKWKNLRKMLISAFTTTSIKTLFENFSHSQKALLSEIKTRSVQDGVIDLEDVAKRFIADFFGDCVFGPDYEKMKARSTVFQKYTKEFQVPTIAVTVKSFFGMYFPKLAKFLGIKLIPKDVSEFFMTSVYEIINQRETNQYKRNDFTQILINMKNNLKQITNYEIALQNFLFFVPEGAAQGGRRVFFALYELSRNQEIQDKLRDEINMVLKECEITYDSIQAMEYLDKVVKETLRKYPSVTFVTRKCIQDYKIPDEDVIIEKGTIVMVPILGLHHDEKYYPDPDTFDPERFNHENKPQLDCNAYLPFGHGPRSCPGMRFGLLILKYFIVTLLKNYKFTVSKKSEEGLKLKTVSAFLNTHDGIWVNAIEVN